MNKKIKTFFGRLTVWIILSLAILPLGAGATDDILTNLQKVGKSTSLIQNTNPYDLVSLIINFLLGFLGVVFLILILFAGYQWMTAGGDSGKVTKAKDLMRNAVIGLVIILAAYAISWWVIDTLLKGINGGTTPLPIIDD